MIPLVAPSGNVYCGDCRMIARPVEYLPIPRDGNVWLFYRCTGEGHVSAALPLPTPRLEGSTTC